LNFVYLKNCLHESLILVISFQLLPLNPQPASFLSCWGHCFPCCHPNDPSNSVSGGGTSKNLVVPWVGFSGSELLLPGVPWQFLLSWVQIERGLRWQNPHPSPKALVGCLCAAVLLFFADGMVLGSSYSLDGFSLVYLTSI